MSFLENDSIKAGIDLNRGGALVYLTRAGGENLINNFDLGRQVQLSFYSGPVPFVVEGQQVPDHWRHIGWNPIQAGDDFKNASEVLAHENDGRRLHVTCRPLQWPLNKVAGDCTFDSWLELEGPVVRGRARLNNTRTDHAQYPARLQELPAVYANAGLHRVVSYTGARPFAGDATQEVPKPEGKHPWSFWIGTEGWSALLDEHDRGLGLITPGRVHFTGGFAGQPGPNETMSNSTGYVAGQGQEILDHNIDFEFRYELVVGSLKEIRDRAALSRKAGLPEWNFSNDRQGWHYQHTIDAGWPITGNLDIRLNVNDPQLISPYTFWRAEEAPFLVIEAAFQGTDKQAVVMWQAHGETTFGKDNMLAFPVENDGVFHRQVIRLADSANYRGGLIRLRLDPTSSGGPKAWLKVRAIKLSPSLY